MFKMLLFTHSEQNRKGGIPPLPKPERNSSNVLALSPSTQKGLSPPLRPENWHKDLPAPPFATLFVGLVSWFFTYSPFVLAIYLCRVLFTLLTFSCWQTAEMSVWVCVRAIWKVEICGNLLQAKSVLVGLQERYKKKYWKNIYKSLVGQSHELFFVRLKL